MSTQRKEEEKEGKKKNRKKKCQKGFLSDLGTKQQKKVREGECEMI